MNKKPGNTQELEKLRRSAERKLAVNSDAAMESLMIDEKRLLHELQVYQIELEMQNEALRGALNEADEARNSAELARERYAELFDFAPIAYFTIGNDGVIQKSNLRSGNLLGIEPYKTTAQNFTHYISFEYRPFFHRFLKKVFSSDGTQSCEITLDIGENPCWVAIEAIADKTRQFCLIAVSDISEHKRVEEELHLAATVYLALGEAIMVADKDNRIVAVNPAFTRLTGYSSKKNHWSARCFALSRWPG